MSKVAQLPVQSDTESTTPAIWAERQPRPVATVVRAASFEEVGNSDASGQLLAASEVIFEGDRFDLESGEAKLSMASGANVLLVAPASLIATSGNRVELRRGELTAKLEKWATGFVVDTPAMTVTDLGTTFSVSAESEHAGEARVLEGLVTVRARAEGAEKQGGLVLAEGDEVRVEGERTERRIDTGKREQDAETLTKLNRERPYKPIFIPSSGQGIRVGDEDPYWRIVSAPEESGYSIPRYAVVSVEHERHARNEPDKSQWISLASDCPNVVANSIYTFATTFDLTGYNHHSARIQCQVLADNGVRAVRVNGQSLAIEPWVDNEFGQVFARNEFRALLIDKGLRAGSNEIEFDVWNGGEAGGPKNEIVAKPNPTAIRVEWHAFGVPLPAGTP